MNVKSATHLWMDWDRPLVDVIMDKTLRDWVTTPPDDTANANSKI